MTSSQTNIQIDASSANRDEVKLVEDIYLCNIESSARKSLLTSFLATSMAFSPFFCGNETTKETQYTSGTGVINEEVWDKKRKGGAYRK